MLDFKKLVIKAIKLVQQAKAKKLIAFKLFYLVAKIIIYIINSIN